MEKIIKQEPRDKIYEKLIKYACKKSDVISFKVITYYAYEEETKREFKQLCMLMNMSGEEMMSKYNNTKLINKIFLKVKDRTDMGWYKTIKAFEKYLSESDNDFEKTKEEIIKRYIKDILYIMTGKNIFKNKIKEITEYLQDNLIKIERETNTTINMHDYDIYFYRVSDEIEKILLERKRLYNMGFPEFPEDIKFYNNECCWLETVSHEELGIMNIDNQGEYDYLERIGVVFQ